MDTSKYTIPLLPNSIAVGLSEDLLQYLIELKFLLLFFDKPHCIFANAGLQFLNESAVDDLRNGGKTKTAAWDDDEDVLSSSLKNLDVILTEEWQETLSYCSPQYHEINVALSDDKNEFGYSDEIVDSSGLFDVDDDDGSFQDENESTEKSFEEKIAEWAIRANMRVMIDTLEMCCNEKIPMIWGDTADTVSASLYTKYLLDKYAKDSESDSENDKTAALLRTIKGDDLLQSIFGLNIVNVATIPTHRIIEFKNRNQDLLISFLSSYRGFLTELQADPLNYRKIVLARTQKITEELNMIKMEILVQRRSEKYKWLERMSGGIYEGAKNGAMVAAWNLLASPLLMAGQVGMSLLSAANLGLKDMTSNRQLENALIFKSSSGYLWKAMKEFEK